MAPREKGGTGGVIPHEDAVSLIAYFKANGIEFSHEEFFTSPEAAQ
jgi:hypothetical protein